MWVRDPVFDDLCVALHFIFEDLGDFLGVVGHHPLQLLGLHQLSGPLHLVLMELGGESAFLFLFFEAVDNLEVSRFHQLLVDFCLVGLSVVIELLLELLLLPICEAIRL